MPRWHRSIEDTSICWYRWLNQQFTKLICASVIISKSLIWYLSNWLWVFWTAEPQQERDSFYITTLALPTYAPGPIPIKSRDQCGARLIMMGWWVVGLDINLDKVFKVAGRRFWVGKGDMFRVGEGANSITMYTTLRKHFYERLFVLFTTLPERFEGLGLCYDILCRPCYEL